MTRGGFRFLITMVSIVGVLQLLVLVSRLTRPWEDENYWFTALFLVTTAFVARLLYVRRHDSIFWDEEEAERERWNQRGRQL